MTRFRALSIGIAAALCIANNGGCMGGGVNSASAAHACDIAITVSMTAQDIAAVFVARGIEPVRAAKVAVAIRTFQMPVETACALVAPTAP